VWKKIEYGGNPTNLLSPAIEVTEIEIESVLIRQFIKSGIPQLHILSIQNNNLPRGPRIFSYNELWHATHEFPDKVNLRN
jgi:hypothetical protein